MNFGLLIAVVIPTLVILYGVVELRKGLTQISSDLRELRGALGARDKASG